jgi:hypothetical protein
LEVGFRWGIVRNIMAPWLIGAGALAALAAYFALLAWLLEIRRRGRMRRRDRRRMERQLRWTHGQEAMPLTWCDTYREHWEFVQDFERFCQPPPVGLGFRMVGQPERLGHVTRVTYSREATADGRPAERALTPAI